MEYKSDFGSRHASSQSVPQTRRSLNEKETTQVLSVTTQKVNGVREWQ
jgi:hypothetical protein